MARAASVKKSTKRNKRLDPEVRKDLILDAAADLIAGEGVSAISMERVAREAGVSKPLVYVYFPNRTTLLQQLLLREQGILVARQAVEVKEARGFEDLIRRTTATYLKFVEERGVHIRRLMNEPTVAAAVEERGRKDRLRAVELLAKAASAEYNIPRKISRLAAEISMGGTGTAGDLISQNAVDRKTIQELNITLALGSIAALQKSYGKKPAAKKPAKRKTKSARSKAKTR